ncbi:P-loop containing nucleoside triphosphate hydrolase protein [Dichotomopilus funicola]|uniref:P-loop containing nucleoside triphosphate hydrolase protein n=1 Tax=Dichotomopilus funicola TaxID=1934379 RepID=A0AAN6UZ04_9PEZI|nr:P-loop containing nucleoside triphosphate hydrolase protein [Dichotomopilus funicola]
MPKTHQGIFEEDETERPTAALSSPALLDKFDRLRDLNIGNIVSLPQLVVVGDQSSGKSSVLESLTGFHFPRAPGLCTRYVTQITCRRVDQESASISIIPSAGADAAQKEKLRGFYAETKNIAGEDFAKIFRDASAAMGIRGDGEEGKGKGDTFSDHVLKIEISGPTQTPLTVIDVPGIFRRSTPGVTTDADMALVRGMIERAIKDERTIILAVVPCNADIATQEILKLATDADPHGQRTMGVLTKPDLATEKANQQVIINLVLGKTGDNSLKLGYCIVKNRGADDSSSSLTDRDAAESRFFQADPWRQLASSNRVGITALRQRLSGMIQSITRKEFPRVREEVQRKLHDAEAKLKALGHSRGDAMSQRAYLAQIANKFQEIVTDAVEAKYDVSRHRLFEDSAMKLITRVMAANERFAEEFAAKGHKAHFENGNRIASAMFNAKYCTIEAESDEDEEKEEVLSEFPELGDILVDHGYVCPSPKDNIMDAIKEVYTSSRGPELGTFGGPLIAQSFKLQTTKWPSLVHRHASTAIILVHAFITRALSEACGPDTHTRTELWDTLLLERLQTAYSRAMDHARFLLDVECHGPPLTLNQYFSDHYDTARGARYEARIKEHATEMPQNKVQGWWLSQAVLTQVVLSKSGNVDQVCRQVHDILQSYYAVSRRRFVDQVCQYVVRYYLLDSKESPLRLFNTELVLGLTDGELESVAGEDEGTVRERERLALEVASLRSAIKILRG